MIETKELLRLWLAGVGKKKIAARLGMDPKTVRRYIQAALEHGLSPAQGETALTDEKLAAVLTALRSLPQRPHGEAWALCEKHRPFIKSRLEKGIRLTKIRKLLNRQGVAITYATLYRFAVTELGFGRQAPTVPVADCGPSEEVQVDTGWMIHLEPDLFGKRRRFRTWIFTAVLSRHRFVYPCFAETTATAIEACESAWEFYGGVFKVHIPDNTKAIVDRADPLNPRLNGTFLEYAQSRGFQIDPTRSRHAKDKARVEKAVLSVREDCFGGESLQNIQQAREHARSWCLKDYGMSRHSRTQRLPLEHFEAEEKPALLPQPTAPYDIPLWSEPTVAPDHCVQVAKALYSLPTRLIGKKLRARADKALVRLYDGPTMVKTHPRHPPGGKSIDPSDFPPEKAAYALRDVVFLEKQAKSHGEAIGRFARAVLDVPLPWTRMRRVYALLGLVKRYGAERVEPACATSLDQQMFDVRRLERMIQIAATPVTAAATNKILPIARYLRPASQYSLPLPKGDNP